jgi:ADP-heptose:LPS heptosyltransferase
VDQSIINSQPLEAKSPVAFHYNGYGDRLLCLPALRALCSQFPNRIKLICGERDRRTFFADLPLADVIELPFERTTNGWLFDADAVAKALGSCDLFISLSSWHSDSINALLHLTKPAESIGFNRNYSRPVEFDRRQHAADRAFSIAQQVRPSLRIEDFSQPVQLPCSEVEGARALRSKIPDFMRVLAIHTHTVPEKMWSRGKLISTLDEFLERHPDYIVFLLDQARYGLDSGKHGKRVFPLPCSEISLARSFAILGEADLFLGVDSCMLHLADLHRIAGVGLFGPTSPQEYGFRFGPHRHVHLGPAMEDISEEDVLAALEEVVEIPEILRDREF